MSHAHYYPNVSAAYAMQDGQGMYYQGQPQGAPMQGAYVAPGMAQGHAPGPGMAPAGSYPVPHDPSLAYAALQAHAYPAQQTSSFFDINNERFFKGLLIGAAATYLLTNETVQRTAIKGAVKAWSMLQGGVEEVKERFQDAEAEIRAAEATKD